MKRGNTESLNIRFGEGKENAMKKAQVKLSTFCAEYDIPRTTVLDLVHREAFPAYKIAKRWYVDVAKFLKWREVNCTK